MAKSFFEALFESVTLFPTNQRLVINGIREMSPRVRFAFLVIMTSMSL
jgi:hypothetical protein